MSVNRWLGQAAPVAQVVNLTVGSTTSGHTFITTINGKDITYTAGSGETTTTIATAIAALLAASEAPEFREVTWTSEAAVVIGTAVTAGRPFTVTESGTGTYSLTTPTASSGPNHVDLAANWSQGTIPSDDDTDDILIEGPAPDLLWGWENLSMGNYPTVRVLASFEGRVGLPYRNEEGGYVEYRGRFFPIDTGCVITIGEGDGGGPALVNLNFNSSATVNVLGTGARISAAQPVVNLKGCTSGTLVVAAGDVGVGADDDTLTGTLTSATSNGGATLTVGRGMTVTTLNNYGGYALHRGTATTLNLRGGEVDNYGALTTVNADPAPDADTVLRWRAATTIATLTFRGQAGARNPVCDCSLHPGAKTMTNATFQGGASLKDPDGTVVMSNAQNWDRASLQASDLGPRYTLTRTV